MEWSDKVNWGGVPEYMREGVTLYVTRGVPPGGFLQALFKNDFMEMGRRADENNMQAFPAYARLLYNMCPSGCYGSPEAFNHWISRGGLKGNAKHEPLAMPRWGRWADQEYEPLKRMPGTGNPDIPA